MCAQGDGWVVRRRIKKMGWMDERRRSKSGPKERPDGGRATNETSMGETRNWMRWRVGSANLGILLYEDGYGAG